MLIPKNSIKLRFPNQPPRTLSANLWTLDGSWRNKFARRMTVAKTDSQNLFVHSPVQLTPAEKNWLDSLGTVSWIMAPNKFHCSDFPWMAEQYPNSKLIGPSNKPFPSLNGRSLSFTNQPQQFGHNLELIPIEGTRIEEAALYQKSTQTLIVCDLVFNMGDVFSGVEKFLMNANRVGGHLGPSRLMKFAFTKNRNELLKSVTSLSQRPISRIIMNHGDIFEGDGSKILRKSFTEIFGEF